MRITTGDIVTSQSAVTFGGMFTLKTKTMTMIGGILTDSMAIFGSFLVAKNDRINPHWHFQMIGKLDS